jgi:hypothetical protein
MNLTKTHVWSRVFRKSKQFLLHKSYTPVKELELKQKLHGIDEMTGYCPVNHNEPTSTIVVGLYLIFN